MNYSIQLVGLTVAFVSRFTLSLVIALNYPNLLRLSLLLSPTSLSHLHSSLWENVCVTSRDLHDFLQSCIPWGSRLHAIDFSPFSQSSPLTQPGFGWYSTPQCLWLSTAGHWHIIADLCWHRRHWHSLYRHGIIKQSTNFNRCSLFRSSQYLTTDPARSVDKQFVAFIAVLYVPFKPFPSKIQIQMLGFVCNSIFVCCFSLHFVLVWNFVDGTTIISWPRWYSNEVMGKYRYFPFRARGRFKLTSLTTEFYR